MRAKCTELFGVLDGTVAGKDFLDGISPTLADVAAGPSLHRLFALGLESPEHEHLAVFPVNSLFDGRRRGAPLRLSPILSKERAVLGNGATWER